MTDWIATAISCSNIAFIKYWGNRDDYLRLPANGSISMNLAGLETTTTVLLAAGLSEDQFTLNGSPVGGAPLERLGQHMDLVRKIARSRVHARVISVNNFPTGTGIASSASGFAALTAAACRAFGLAMSERELTILARRGSGSACRSIPGGYVEWAIGDNHETSCARTIAPADHWELVDLVAVVSREHKVVGSADGHRLASSSALQLARIVDSERRLDVCRKAIETLDFGLLAAIIEEDTLIMHAVMMTSHPALFYWLPATISIIRNVNAWRDEGIAAAFTIDAGPNVHVITTIESREIVRQRLAAIPGVVEVLVAKPGGPTRIIDQHLVG